MSKDTSNPADKLDGLNDKQRLFVAEYAIDWNATKAAIRAGYEPACASVQGSRLLANVKIRNSIRDMQEDRFDRLEATAERIILEYTRLAFLDPAELVDEGGATINLHDMHPDVRAAIAGIEVFEEFEGIGEDRCKIGETRKFKLASKLTALEGLCRIKAMFNDKVTIDLTKLSTEKLLQLRAIAAELEKK